LYNPPGHFIHTIAGQLREEFETRMLELVVEFAGSAVNKEIINKWLVEFPLTSKGVSAAEVDNYGEDDDDKTVVRGKTAETLVALTATAVHSTPFSRSSHSEVKNKYNVCDDKETAQSKGWNEDRVNMLAKPQLGFKGAMIMMSELAKAVYRLKDDLFCVKLASSDCSEMGETLSLDCNDQIHDSAHFGQVLGKRKIDTENTGIDYLNENADMETADNAEEVPRLTGKEAMLSSYCDVSVLEATASITNKDDNASRKRKKSGGIVGRPRGDRGRRAGYEISESDDRAFAPHVLALLQDVKNDTSDPDPTFSNPFVDSRHTFLEMCQFRHYQFDSLRRAKHSSLMLLYHLHHPFDLNLRPICSLCRCTIRDIRWHCDVCVCPDFDICSSCYNAQTSPSDVSENQKNQIDSETQPIHNHPLTPFRVSFF
jgi:hypothetical protein